jgi:hypothetical protein
MATKKVKKLAFGGMANRAAQMASMAKGRAMPQAPARDSQSAPSMEQLNAAKQAMLGSQKGQSQNSSPMGAKLAAQMADQRAGQEKLSNAAAGSAIAQMPMKNDMSSMMQKRTGITPNAPANVPTTTKFKGMLPSRPMKKGGAVKHEDVKMDKKVVKKAVKMHDDQLHGGKKTDLTKLAKGGVAKKVTKEMEYDYKTGKKSFAGSTAKRDAHAEKEGKRVAKDLAYDMKKYAKGGSIDGCAIRGKTKATMVKMKKGGAC